MARGGDGQDSFLLPTPAADLGALVRAVERRHAVGRPVGRLGGASLIGYGISVAIGVVVGIAIGTFRSVEAFFEAQIGFLRYIPASALTPLFLLWLGIDESPKISLIVVGTVFFNILMVADVARAVPRELVNAAYTLGAGRLTVLRRVILPHSLPGIIDVARINLAAGLADAGGGRAAGRAGGPGLPDRAGPALPRRRHDVRPAHRVRRDRHGQRPVPRWLRRAPWTVGQPASRRHPACSGRPKAVVDGVTKVVPGGQRDVVALDGVDLHVADGELVCLVGASGCGSRRCSPSSAGSRRPRAGEVPVDGDLVVGPGPDRGMVFQGYSLFPWKTVADNIAFGLECAGWPRAAGRAGRRAARGHGPRRVRRRLPRELSGGMRQRVAIARALAPEPDVLLLDEPFGALDAQTRRTMQDFLLTVWQRTGATILMVTHDGARPSTCGGVVVMTSAGTVADVVEVPFGRSRGPEVRRDERFWPWRTRSTTCSLPVGVPPSPAAPGHGPDHTELLLVLPSSWCSSAAPSRRSSPARWARPRRKFRSGLRQGIATTRARRGLLDQPICCTEAHALPSDPGTGRQTPRRSSPRVGKWETVTITDRGRPVALLTAIPLVSAPRSCWRRTGPVAHPQPRRPAGARARTEPVGRSPGDAGPSGSDGRPPRHLRPW